VAGLILDASALIAADRNDRCFFAFWSEAVARRVVPVLPASALARACGVLVRFASPRSLRRAGSSRSMRYSPDQLANSVVWPGPPLWWTQRSLPARRGAGTPC